MYNPADCTSPHLRRKALSERQKLTLSLVLKGLRNDEIARVLGLSCSSVEWYLSQLFLIFEVTNRTELVGVTAQVENRFDDLPCAAGA